MTKTTRKKINLNIQAVKILENMSEHYRLTESMLIELLFILSIDLDLKKKLIKNNTSLNFNPEIKEVKPLHIRFSEDKYAEMKAVAKSYKLTLPKYIQSIIFTSYNQNSTNQLIENIF